MTRRSHVGHAHGHHHHHHHDNTFLLSRDKKDAGVRITRIGLYINLGMAMGKGVGGYMFNSQALSADAIHSLTDLVSDIMTLATVGWSLSPPSNRFPNGYGKVESLGSLGVSGILLSGGLLMGWAASIALCQQFFPEAAHLAAHWGLLPHSHAHHHGLEGLGPSINAAWLAGGSILVKEWLYRATMKVAKERNSTVLAANAYHHRVDSLTALVALLLIAGSNVFRNAQWLDPVGGLIISLMVIQAGWSNTKAALFELADAGIDDETKDKIWKAVMQPPEGKDLLPESVTIRAVQGIKAGQNYLVDVDLVVPGTWTIEQAQRSEDVIRQNISTRVRAVKKVRVRYIATSAQESALSHEFVSDDPRAPSAPASEAEHDHHDNHGPKHVE